MKTIASIALALALLGCQRIPPPLVRPFADGREWVLEETLRYAIGDTTHVIEVPDGFVTDFASIPRSAWSVLEPTGRYGRAGIVHDFLYWDQGCTREQADEIMLLAMIESDVQSKTRSVIFMAVRARGEGAWRDNAKDRAEGLPRVIPETFRPIPAMPSGLATESSCVSRGFVPRARYLPGLPRSIALRRPSSLQRQRAPGGSG